MTMKRFSERGGGRRGMVALLKLPLHKNLRKIVQEFVYLYYDRSLPTDPEELNGLPVPALKGLRARVNSDEFTVYASCDSVYYQKYGKSFIGSLVKHMPGYAIHLHIINPDPTALTELAQLDAALSESCISYTWEIVDLAGLQDEERGIYYYSVRFLRFYQFVRDTGCPALCLDIDVLVNADAGRAIARLRDVDLAFYSRFKKFGSNTKLLAGTLYVNNTSAGRYFLTRTGKQVERFLRARLLIEKLDQQIIYKAYQSTLAAYPDCIFRSLAYPLIDLEFTAQGLIWYPKGQSKKSSKYLELERRFTRRVSESLESLVDS
jgi:hypothetical protein